MKVTGDNVKTGAWSGSPSVVAGMLFIFCNFIPAIIF